MAKVDNFSIIRKLLKFENPGDCYYLQLLRRQSDDPMIDGKPDPNYHGNMHSRSIKDYFIPSLEYFDQKEDEIKKLCDFFNVRAYIMLNKRNYKQISFAIMKHITEQLVSGQSFNSPFSLVASAAGNANCAGDAKTWILDLDEEYLTYKSVIYDMILQCEPIATKWKEFQDSHAQIPWERHRDIFAEENFSEVPTKHGIHIISRPFNTKTFKDLWEEYTMKYKITAPIPQNKEYENGKTVFSLTDKYLDHAEALKECLRSAKRNPTGAVEIVKIDQNMTLVKIDCKFDLTKLYREWHIYCASEHFLMKALDMHKDNPSVLYCP